LTQDQNHFPNRSRRQFFSQIVAHQCEEVGAEFER
jgi:hypothetical protein